MQTEEINEIKTEINKALSQYQEIMMKEAMETRRISVNMIHQQKQTIKANIPRFNFIITLCAIYTMLQVTTYLLWKYHPDNLKSFFEVVFLGKLVDVLKFMFLN